MSSVVPGEYAPAVVAFIALAAYSLLLNFETSRPSFSFDLFNIMSGDEMAYLRSDTMTGPMPSLALITIALFALGLLAIAVRIIEKKDFS